MDTNKPLEEYTMSELKDLARTEGIEGLESFDKKAQVLAILSNVRLARMAGTDKAPEKPVEQASDPAPVQSEPVVSAPVDQVQAAAEELPDQPVVDTTPADEDINAPIEPITPATPEQLAAQATVAPATVNPVTPPEDPTDQQEWKKETDRIRSVLAAQPKVRIYVPLEIGEKRGAYLPVIINGYRVDILKGVYVEVAQSVADVVSDSFNQTAEVGRDLLLDRVDPNTGKSVSAAMGLQG